MLCSDGDREVCGCGVAVVECSSGPKLTKQCRSEHCPVNEHGYAQFVRICTSLALFSFVVDTRGPVIDPRNLLGILNLEDTL